MKVNRITNNTFSDNSTGLRLRGRHFTPTDLDIIRRVITAHFSKGRTYISRIICDELDWKQPNGWPKDRACRDVLLRLEKLELIELPQSRRVKKTRNSSWKGATRVQLSPRTSEIISEFPSEIILELAKSSKAEQLWNALIAQHHYLGHSVAVGRCLKYLVKSGDTLLGAIAFSSPAWRIAPRDSLLASIGIDREEIRDRVINNTRFLILPNVRIQNLASSILSLTTKKVVLDWTEYYSITPLVVETFVQPSLFHGTCYKAANWIQIGSTKGYAKKGSSYHNSQEPKEIFLYGLNRRIRRQLSRVVSLGTQNGNA